MKILNTNLLFTLFLVFYSVALLAQIETNNWYFGNKAGINFNDNTVTVLTDSAMKTPAGCSSISDKDGALLFYTNGQMVWNRNHQIMLNGTQMTTNTNTVQTCIIVPKPGNENVYYIFATMETYETEPYVMGPGVYYSEVTFSPEFPLGKVTINNQRIYSTTSSKITAIHHAESNTIRVITFGRVDNELPLKPRNTFYIFNVTSEGVQIPAIVKPVEQNILGLGAMKISPDGKKIALVDEEERYIHLYNFNNETLDIEYDMPLNPDEFMLPQTPYSVAFSQNSKILYYTVSLSQGTKIYQFGLYSTGEFPDKFLISSTGTNTFGDIQLASNGKIYVANYKNSEPPKFVEYISVIHEPEKLDTESQFELNAISFPANGSLRGLPNFVSSFLRNRILTEDRCVSDTFDFDLDAYTDVTAVSWDFGDGSTSTSMTPSHQFTAPGEYVVKAMITINNYPQPLYKKVEVFPLPTMAPNQTLQQCDLDNDGRSNFNLKNIIDFVDNGTPEHELVFYNSLTDAENGVDEIENSEMFENTSNPQELFVKITSPQGCVYISNFFIETTFTPLDGLATMFTCENSDSVLNDNQGLFGLAAKEIEIRNQIGIPATSTITFYASSLDAETKTNALPADYIATSSTIWVRVDNQDFSCNGIGTLQLVVNSDLGLNLEDEYLICNPKMRPPTVLDGGSGNDRWEWKNDTGTIISTNREFTLLQSGNYSLTVYRTENGIECVTTKNFTVTEAAPPEFIEVKAENEQIFVTIDGTSDYEFSLDDMYFFGSGTSHIFYGVEGGIYTVYVRDRNKCELPIKTEVALVNYPSFFTPNQDGFNDSWKIEGISTRFYFDANIYIYDRYGKLLHFMDLPANNQSGWDGTINGKLLLASDYWFNATLTDLEGKKFSKKGHFSLIR